ncbi:hypothetical protein BH11PLA1_BH11PLA1_02860 [soil metagenome]
MTCKFPVLCASIAALIAASSAAFAQHFGDIGLSVQAGRMITGSFDGGTFVTERVYAATFGELFPNFANNPGFDSLAGAFTTPSSIGFVIHGPVRSYDPVMSTFSVTTPPTIFQIGFASLPPVFAPSTEVDVTGFSLAVSSNGEWHRHLAFTVPSGTADGIYLLELSLFSSNPAVAPSQNFVIVFNQNRSAAEHAAALVAAQGLLTGARCSPADIADDQGSPLPTPNPNNGVNEGDYNAFFNSFFINQALGSPADIASDDGTPLPPFGAAGRANNGVNEGDYNCFFNTFFNGCPA